MSLSKDQRRALSILNQGKNVLLTGGAGTGKTFLLDEYLKGKNAIRVAPTGKAAIKLGGVTIHRFFKAPIGIIEPNKVGKIPSKPDAAEGKLTRTIGEDNTKILKNAKIIAIDEISMCRSDLFEYVYSLVKMAERAFDRKIQVVLCGDFFQLPPITPRPPRGNNGERVRQEWEVWQTVSGDNLEGWPFLSKSWQDANIQVVELHEIIRQKEPEFATALNQIRMGNDEGLEWIKAHCAQGRPSGDFLSIVGKNDKAAAENLVKLSAIASREQVYEVDCPYMLQNGKINEATAKDYKTVCEERLVLRVGARVIALINDTTDNQYVNGSTGTVKELRPDSVVVQFDNGNLVDVGLHKWTLTGYEIQKRGKETIIKPKTLGEFSQIPLRLAWASTVHKSQGETIDGKIEVICTPQFFAAGMAYVALSRATSIKNLYITGKPKVIVSEAVKRFFQTINQKEEMVPEYTLLAEPDPENLDEGSEFIFAKVEPETEALTQKEEEIPELAPVEEIISQSKLPEKKKVDEIKPKPKEEERRRGKGRPGAFKEVQLLSLKLPPEFVYELKTRAALANMTVAQFIYKKMTEK